jgi:uncharacterized protein (DUF2345 family)
LGKVQISSFSDVNAQSVTGNIDVRATQNIHMDGLQIRLNEGAAGISVVSS